MALPSHVLGPQTPDVVGVSLDCWGLVTYSAFRVFPQLIPYFLLAGFIRTAATRSLANIQSLGNVFMAASDPFMPTLSTQLTNKRQQVAVGLKQTQNVLAYFTRNLNVALSAHPFNFFIGGTKRIDPISLSNKGTLGISVASAPAAMVAKALTIYPFKLYDRVVILRPDYSFTGYNPNIVNVGGGGNQMEEYRNVDLQRLQFWG